MNVVVPCPAPLLSSLTTFRSAAAWSAARALSRAESWASSVWICSVHCCSRARTCCCAQLLSLFAEAWGGSRGQLFVVTTGALFCPSVTQRWVSNRNNSLSWPPARVPLRSPGLLRSWNLGLVLVLGGQLWAPASPKTQPSFTLLSAALYGWGFSLERHITQWWRTRALT